MKKDPLKPRIGECDNPIHEIRALARLVYAAAENMRESKGLPPEFYSTGLFVAASLIEDRCDLLVAKLYPNSVRKTGGEVVEELESVGVNSSHV